MAWEKISEVNQKEKSQKCSKISKWAQGGACVKIWCKKEKESGPAQRLCLQPLDVQTEQTRASCYLMIPGLSSKTHNMKSVEH